MRDCGAPITQLLEVSSLHHLSNSVVYAVVFPACSCSFNVYYNMQYYLVELLYASRICMLFTQAAL